MLPSREKRDRDYPPSPISESRLGAATSLGGIAQYGTECTGRIESASDGNKCGVSEARQPALGIRPQTGRFGSASPSDSGSGVGGDAFEKTETAFKRSDGSDHEPVPVTAGRLTSGARCLAVIVMARLASADRAF